MTCPECKKGKMLVTNTRESLKKAKAVYRDRECTNCGFHETFYEFTRERFRELLEKERKFDDMKARLSSIVKILCLCLLLFSPFSLHADQREDLTFFIFSQYDYVEDSVLFSVEDYWQEPPELFLNKKGDCEDFAISLMFLFRGYGIDSTLVIVSFLGKEGEGLHTLVEAGGDWYDPTIGKRVEKKYFVFHHYITRDKVLDILISNKRSYHDWY